MKFVVFAKSESWLSFEPKTAFLSPKMGFEKLPVIATSWRRHKPLTTLTEEIINRGKFDVCMPGRFGLVKIDKHTELRFMYWIMVLNSLYRIENFNLLA